MRAFPIVAVAALACFCLACQSERESSGIAIDQIFRNLIWPQATVLAGANLRVLEKTDFYKRYAAQLDFPALQEASERLGFDPRKDVDRLLLESDGRRSLVLAKGDLRSSEIRDKLGKLGARTSVYRSVPMIGDERNAVALVGFSTVIGGATGDVRSAVDLAAGRGGAINPELQKRLESLPKSAQIWIVGRNGLPFANAPMRSDVRSALSNIVSFITGVTAGVTVGSGAQLEATISCISPLGAQRVHDALRGAIGLARLSTKEDQTELLKVYDAIDVKQSGTVVELNAALNGNEVDQLMNYLPQVKSRAGALLR